jgi:hypothetical protein
VVVQALSPAPFLAAPSTNGRQRLPMVNADAVFWDCQDERSEEWNNIGSRFAPWTIYDPETGLMQHIWMCCNYIIDLIVRPSYPP